jgi:squalene cyclase
MLHFDAFQHWSRTRAVRPVVVTWKRMFPHHELQHWSGARESIALLPKHNGTFQHLSDAGERIALRPIV